MTRPALAAAEDGSFRLSGQVLLGTVADLLAQSEHLLFGRAGKDPVVVDLSGVDHADSAALALLLEWMAMAAADGRTLEFRALPDALCRLAGLSNVDSLLPTGPAA